MISAPTPGANCSAEPTSVKPPEPALPRKSPGNRVDDPSRLGLRHARRHSMRLAKFFEGLPCGFSGIASVSLGDGRPVHYAATRDPTFRPAPRTPFQVA